MKPLSALETEARERIHLYTLASSVVLLFVAANAVTPGLISGLASAFGVDEDAVREGVVAPLRHLLLLAATIGLLMACVKSGPVSLNAERSLLLRAALGFALMAVLIVPFQLPFGTASMGEHYSRMSIDPLLETHPWYTRRVFVPWVANLMGLYGAWYYVLSLIGSFAVAAATIAVWRRAVGELPSRTQTVMLLSSSYFAYTFHNPGYVEAWVLVLGALVFLETRRDRVFVIRFVAAYSLALVIHESAAVAVFLPLFMIRRNRELAFAAGLVTIAYVFTLGLGSGLVQAAQVQTTVGQQSSFAWVAENWPFWLAGVALSFGLLWPFVFAGTDREDIAFVASAVGAVLALSLLGVDTTRIILWATIPVVFVGAKSMARLSRRWAGIVAWVIIAVPYVYVGLNTGLAFPRYGVYSWLGDLLMSISPSATL